MVAIGKALGAQLCAFALDLCHLNLKFLSCPRVARFRVVLLRATFGIIVLITILLTFGRCQGVQFKVFSTSEMAHSS